MPTLQNILTSLHELHNFTNDMMTILSRGILAVLGWGMLLGMLWQILGALRSAIAISTRMHQIPCPRCRFFTGDYRLKCTVSPYIASTSTAIGCRDFHPEA